MIERAKNFLRQLFGLPSEKVIIYTEQAHTSKPAQWTRKGRCPGCGVKTRKRHKPACQAYYVYRK